MTQTVTALYDTYDLADKDPDLRSRRPECVRVVMRQAVGRTWAHLAKERLEDTSPTIPLGKRFWPISEEEREEIERIFATEDVRLLVTALRSRENEARVEVLDAAYWMKGCSSLGRLRFAVLLGVGRSVARRGQKPNKRGRPMPDRHQGSCSGGSTAPF
jgi:uncharacterized protein (DUF2252 family)